MASPTQTPEIVLHLPGDKRDSTTMPAALRTGTRAGTSGPDPFLDGVVTVDASFRLDGPGRGTGAQSDQSIHDGQLLALETSDGTTVFIRADKLKEDLARVRPEAIRADGSIDLALLTDPRAASRGISDWLWSGLSVLSIGKDSITDTAREKAQEWLKDALGETAEDLAYAGASWLGTKALMWAIESRLAGQPGLYQWRDGNALAGADRCQPNDERLTRAAAEGPMLIFVHGTASHTLGGFKDMRAGGAGSDWESLARRFGDRVFGFEHRTFSESPIDNALQLARNLPAGARISLVSHSRGGLVADLICLAGLSDEAIKNYRREAPVNATETSQQKRLREKIALDEQESLRALRQELADKNFRIERYVRVACPARGTTLLSDNLDVFLSGLLSLTGKLAGAVAGPAGSMVLSAFKRIVLEIANNRVEPQLVPGIEAMLIDAPMGALLANAQRKQGIAMSVISGDIEGGGMLQRLGVLFTDWMLFDRIDNDLVVDTDSMYAGLAVSNETRFLFDQGAAVNHFSYFANRYTRSALRDWLTAEKPDALPAFGPMARYSEAGAAQARSRAASRKPPTPDSRPVVILLPGIMGSHLEMRKAGTKVGDGDRVWFDFFDLASGGLPKISFDRANVHEESLFDMYYGDLADFLEASHTVIRFPYDWRRPIQAPDGSAERLAKVVEQALRENPTQPIRLLAHSMGGLVSRTMIAQRPDLWAKIVRRPGGRLVMLGTPNNGSHLMVETLLGKSGSMRKLARLDLRNGMQRVLDTVAGFPGALQLLPRPGFADRGPSLHPDYLQAPIWSEMATQNRDRWFGDGATGKPDPKDLKLAADLWADALLGNNDAPEPPERVTYVFGQAESTPCGVRLSGGQLKMVGTPEGDGSVTWASGRLNKLPDDNYWFMPVDHGTLTDAKEYFPAIADLLHTGITGKLGRLPASRGAAADATFTYDAPPPVLPTEEELARSLLGARPRRRAAKASSLQVSVAAGDLRFARQPVMCGHYSGDAIAGAEDAIDEYLVDRALRQRSRLGVYAGEIGSSSIVLQKRSAEERLRGTGKGAVIVGLGRLGELSGGEITETVRAGVLRFLLHALDHDTANDVPAETELTLASLLIGYNSTAHIGVEDSIAAIVRGVLEGNHQFANAMPKARRRVAHLQFIELFMDTAISAAHAARALPERLAADLRRLDTRVEALTELIEGEGARPRLSVFAPFGYWPRLIVTDAERTDDCCPPECYEAQIRSPIPEATLRRLLDNVCADGTQPAGAPAPRKAPPQPYASKLKYVLLSERARAEAVVQQSQPGLIESLVKHAITVDQYSEDLSRTLFQLMVPPDFKAAAREMDQLVLVLDGYTANLPWEMLQADEHPMALQTAVVRQFATTRFRRNPVSITRKIACVVANPSSRGYYTQFGDPAKPPKPAAEDHLPDLPGAVAEAAAIQDILNECGYETAHAEGLEALDVFARLFRQPYRMLIIAAHGIFEARGQDGKLRSGVVLSDGLLLTAAEVSQMEVVPELVFLNCCHLGAMTASTSSANRLAYSLARELIEMGVRCVVAAGWQVNDQAAKVFATTFFDRFVRSRRPFGRAVFEARKATWEQFPQYNTWGAYQAYGDPQHMLEPMTENPSDDRPRAMASPAELLDQLTRLRTDLAHHTHKVDEVDRKISKALSGAPPDWQNLPEVQAAIGAVYGELGTEGFVPACTAYCRAIAMQDKSGRVPINTIEQLANLEARTGESRNDVDLIETAIGRLNGLIALSTSFAAATDSATHINPQLERWAALGSTLKRKAAAMAATGSNWAKVEAVLKESHGAYAKAAGNPDAPNFDPYGILNRLQLDWLLMREKDAATGNLADRCTEAARKRFARSGDFFDAVKPADAALIKQLQAGFKAENVAELAKTYSDAVSHVPTSARKFDSVVKQICLLARFVALRNRRGDREQAEALASLAQTVGGAPCCQLAAPPETPDVTKGPDTAPDATPPAPPPPKKRRPRKS